MAILAYNRNLGGRKLVYKLTELFIKVGDFENATDLYQEYVKSAAHDVNKYILYYDLRRAQKAPANELVEILEEYKNHEIDEKYMYELAALYYQTGRKEECIKVCDNLVLWFQDGIYVEKAVALKAKLNSGLSNTQQRIILDAVKKKEDMNEQKERLFEQQKELANLKKDDVEEAISEDEDDNVTDDNAVEEEAAKENIAESEVAVTKEIPASPVIESKVASVTSPQLTIPGYEDSIDDGPLSMDLVQNEPSNEIREFVMKAIGKSNSNTGRFEKVTVEGPKLEKPELEMSISESGASTFSNEVNKANLSLKELIESAKTKLDNNYEKINKEDEEEQRREAEAKMDEAARNMDINVPVPNYNFYDTQNLQAELAAGMSDIFAQDDEEDDDDIRTFMPSPSPKPEVEEPEEVQSDNEQIEGQMNIAEWMESVREEKYGNQDTKEFSKAELNKYLDEKDEKSAAYERLVEKMKADALARGAAIDTEEAKRQASIQMSIDAVKMDLAIRTGKAALRLEVAAELAASEVVPLVTAQIPTVSEEMISNIQDIMVEDKNDFEKQRAEILAEAARLKEEEAATEEEIPVPMPSSEDVAVQPKKIVRTRIRPVAEKAVSDNDGSRKLTGELARIFKKYREMPGLEEQLVTFFESIDEEMNMTNSSVGNILITGNSSSDKTDLARTIVRAINTLYPDKQKLIAKTSGDSINQRGITKAMSKLYGKALIVEGAGTIQPKRINELLNCLEQDTDRLIVIFEDSDTDMNVLINFNPEITSVFNHRIVLKQYTVNELVEMAKRFARKRQYEVDDDALLELYLKIDRLHNVNDNIKLDDIKDIINQAILNSEKRASRRFFGGLKKRRSENGDVIFLTEADFKDR